MNKKQKDEKRYSKPIVNREKGKDKDKDKEMDKGKDKEKDIKIEDYYSNDNEEKKFKKLKTDGTFKKGMLIEVGHLYNSAKPEKECVIKSQRARSPLNEYTLSNGAKLKFEYDFKPAIEKYRKSSCNDPIIKNLKYFFENTDKDKDKEINQLKAHIIKLENKQKDYDELNQKYEQLQNDYTLVNNAKNRLEYELNQRTKELNRLLDNLRGKSEILQKDNRDKISRNKRLSSDNVYLTKELELKDIKINKLSKEIEELKDNLNKNKESQKANEIEKTSNDTLNKDRDNNSLYKNKKYIDTLIKQLENCNQIIDEKNKQIENFKLEIINLKKDKSKEEPLPNEKCFAIQFISVDQKINRCFATRENEIFCRIEERLYQKYPEYSESDNYFLCNGSKIKRFKSLKENGIRDDGETVILYRPVKSE